MPIKDLREFIRALQDSGGIKTIEGASCELEIGGVTQIAADSAKCPALLFDAIKGFPKGHRVLTNVLANKARERLVFGVAQELSDKEALRSWKEKLKQPKPISPAQAKLAPVKQNTVAEDQVDLGKFPWLRWHENDRDRCQYGALLVTRDPTSGQIGITSHPLALVGRDTIVARVAPGDIDPVWQKYWIDGKPCPVAISLGQDPALLAAAIMGAPAGNLDYDFAGWIRGEPVEVTDGDFTGLPIPAAAEVILEGELAPPGEVPTQTGNGHPGPTVKVNRIYFRNDPIIIGNPPIMGSTHGVLASRAAYLWNELEDLGVASIMAVNHRPWGATIVSIKQLDAGHVKRVARALMESSAGRNLRFAIIVDEDIDPYNLEKVFWAIATRYEPQYALDIARRLGGDSVAAEGGGSAATHTGSAAIIDACRPFQWMDKFPRTTDISEELVKKTVEKWGKIFAQRG